eukprot:1147689-Pelagomonas_calceolata.AAC.11
MECVKRLLANVNDAHNIVAVVRDPKKYEGAFPQDVRKPPCASRRNLLVFAAAVSAWASKNHARLNLVAGDVTDKGSLQKALQGCQYVINAASGKLLFHHLLYHKSQRSFMVCLAPFLPVNLARHTNLFCRDTFPVDQ